ncbi:hypothetical protein AAMO2058_001461300 [Amorphochlora amoebiformis]
MSFNPNKDALYDLDVTLDLGPAEEAKAWKIKKEPKKTKLKMKLKQSAQSTLMNSKIQMRKKLVKSKGKKPEAMPPLSPTSIPISSKMPPLDDSPTSFSTNFISVKTFSAEPANDSSLKSKMRKASRRKKFAKAQRVDSPDMQSYPTTSSFLIGSTFSATPVGAAGIAGPTSHQFQTSNVQPMNSFFTKSAKPKKMKKKIEDYDDESDELELAKQPKRIEKTKSGGNYVTSVLGEIKMASSEDAVFKALERLKMSLMNGGSNVAQLARSNGMQPLLETMKQHHSDRVSDIAYDIDERYGGK